MIHYIVGVEGGGYPVMKRRGHKKNIPGAEVSAIPRPLPAISDSRRTRLFRWKGRITFLEEGRL
jgi:hypothetical protein